MNAVPILSAVLSLGLSASPEVPPRPTALPPTGDEPAAGELLARYESALGERAATLRLEGRATWAGLPISGEVTEIYGGAGRARQTQVLPSQGSFESGCDGELVWERTPVSGATVRRGWLAAEHLRRFGLAQQVGWRELYSEARTLGEAELEGERCWKLEMVPLDLANGGEEGRPAPDLWYLDRTSGLLRRVELFTPGAEDPSAVTRLDFFDWRAVGGQQIPHRREITISHFTLRLEFDRIERDVALAEDAFDPGPDVAAVAAGETEGEHAGAVEPGAISIETLDERYVATIRVTTTMADMQKTLTAILPEAMEAVLASGAQITGPPLVRYHNWGDPLDVEGGIPIAAPIEPTGRVRTRDLPAGRAVVSLHVGPYDQLGQTHARIHAYLADEGLQMNGSPWEEYLTDPGLEPDPSKWKTKVVYPIE